MRADVLVASVGDYQLVMKVLDHVSQGKPVTRACRDCGLPYTRFRRLVEANAELRELRLEAEQVGYDTMADMLLTIDDPGQQIGSSDAAKMKILSDNIKWFLARKRPKDYGDRMTVDHNITADQAIIEALAAGKDKAAGVLIEHTTGEVVEAVVMDAIDPLAEYFR